MSPNFQRTSLWLCVLAGSMAASSAAFAEPTQSLAERRLSIIKRTSAGIVLIDLPGEQRPSAAAPAPVTATTGSNTSPNPAASSGPSQGASSGAISGAAPSPTPGASSAKSAVSAAPAKPAEAAAAQPAVLNRFFSSMPAPSGKSLQEARRLDAPDQGIQLPFGRSAPLPAAEPEPKR